MRSPTAAAAAAAAARKTTTRTKNNVGANVTPCCSKVGLKKGPWTPQEDELLTNYINKEGEGRWRTLPKQAGLLRCGKSCRLRWMNYLRPSVKRGQIAPDEEDLILRLHRLLGNRWSLIAGRIPGRTDNEIKNYWNTHLSKKLIGQGIDPRTHKPLNSDQRSPFKASASSSSMANEESNRIIINKQNYYHRVEMKSSNGEEGDEDGINCCTTTDDVLSSFLNSLINEDAFTYQNQMQTDALVVSEEG
ncbi:hypothetical protein V6N13_013881 [Hibiscus sabdariffa]|uniref:Uncharacterized protein n=1 Tax=Hibiscus sabdariffa TaxID=183260 RepID=A0ABR2RTX5_9ROSI